MIYWHELPTEKIVKINDVFYFKTKNITNDIDLEVDSYKDNLIVFNVYKLSDVAIAFSLKAVANPNRKYLYNPKYIFISYTPDTDEPKNLTTVFYDDNVRFLKFGKDDKVCYLLSYKIKQKDYYEKSDLE